jgi:hypothetical protein
MAAYALRYREALPPSVLQELDDLVAYYNNVLTAINEGGTLNWNTAMGLPQPKPDQIYSPLTTPLSSSLADFIESFKQAAEIGSLVGSSSVYQANAILSESDITNTSNTGVFEVAKNALGIQYTLWPMAWSIEKIITPSTGTRAISAAGVLQLIHATTDFLGFTLATDINCDLTVGGRSHTGSGIGAGRNFSNYSTRDPRGKGLGVSFSSATGTFSGTGTMTLRVSIMYYALPAQAPGVTP